MTKMTKHKQQDGFGIVEIIIILVLVGALAFVGWKVYESQISTPAVVQNEDQKEQVKPAEEKYATYTDPDFGYKFQYPKAWKTSDEAAKMFGSPESPTEYSITIESPDFATTNEGIGYHLTNGAQMYVHVEPTTFDTPEAYFNRNGFLPAAASDKKEMTVDGNAALRYIVNWESSHLLTTITIKNGQVYTLTMSYADATAHDAYKADYDSLVTSFKLPVE